jgi:SP family myo-inositol transporter-like MFS transporter 13
MPWTINSEIYPLHLRSLGVSLATMVNWAGSTPNPPTSVFVPPVPPHRLKYRGTITCAGNLLIAFTFLNLTRLITTYGAFWLYAAIGALGWVYFYFFLPETAGRSLEEIQALFKRDTGLRRGA